MTSESKVNGMEMFGYWDEHSKYPVRAWQEDVLRNETRAGYWDWVRGQMEEERKMG